MTLAFAIPPSAPLFSDSALGYEGSVVIFVDRRRMEGDPEAVALRNLENIVLELGKPPATRPPLSTTSPHRSALVYGRSMTDRMLPAGSLNQAIGKPSSRMIPRSSWSNPS